MFVLAGAVLPLGSALADGGPVGGRVAQRAADPVVARLNFQCQGKVQVQLVRRASTVQIVFAGRSRVVELNRDPGGNSSRNTQFTWTLQNGVGTMKRNADGQSELSRCRRLN